jgi:hypothetical protein
LTYNIVDRENVNEKVKPGSTGQFTNDTELKPFLEKWAKEFPAG